MTMEYDDARQTLFCVAASALKEYRNNRGAFGAKPISLGTVVQAWDAVTAIPFLSTLPDEYTATPDGALILHWSDVNGECTLDVRIEDTQIMAMETQIYGKQNRECFVFRGSWPESVLKAIAQIKAQESE